MVPTVYMGAGSGGSVQTRRHVLWLFGRFLLGILCVLVWVPLGPSMPNWGLDPSWMLGLNQAVADGLVFGRDIKFTFGPYSSIYSQLYHPATYGMTLLAGGILAAGYGWALFRTFSQGGRDMLLAGVVLALGILSRDALLLSYPVLYVLAVHKVIVSAREGSEGLADTWRIAGQLTALAISSAGLAVLLLVKGSIFPLATIAFFVVLGLCVANRSHVAMVTIGASAIAGSLLLWLLGGATDRSIPGLLRGAGQRHFRLLGGHGCAGARPRSADLCGHQFFRAGDCVACIS